MSGLAGVTHQKVPFDKVKTKKEVKIIFFHIIMFFLFRRELMSFLDEEQNKWSLITNLLVSFFLETYAFYNINIAEHKEIVLTFY